MPDSADASEYIRSSFRPGDRIALLLIHRQNGAVIQRIGPVSKLASEAAQRWLADKNGDGHDIYLGMNSLKPDAQGRTKTDVAEIRHLYLDIDHDAEAVLDTLNSQPDIPQPNHVISTSPGKIQVVWKAEGYSLTHAENLQRQLSREFGADPASTDATRVLRLPGFLNLKYDPPYAVGVQTLTERIHHPEDFRSFEDRPRPDPARRSPGEPRGVRPGHVSQSERDWAYAKRELWRGRAPNAIAEAIAEFRKGEKSDPRYYAERTVERAGEALDAEGRGRQSSPER